MAKRKNKWVQILMLISVFALLFSGMALPVFAVNDDCAAGRHDYGIVVHNATENEDGEKIFTCKICGYKYIEILPATGHDWSAWITDRKATCTGPGQQHRTCSRNKHALHTEERTVPATGHQYIEKSTDADCKHGGKIIYTCKQCGGTYEKENGKALGHQYIETIMTPPDCETEGIKEFKCDRCGNIYTEPIPVTGHSYGEWIIDKEAAENEEGHKHRVCANNSSHILNGRIEPPAPAQTPPFPNALDMILTSAGMAGFSIFGVSIYRDYKVMSWDAGKRKLRLATKGKGVMK